MRNRIVAAACAAVALAGCSSAQQGLDTSADDGYFGAVLEEQYDAPTVSLTDTGGASYSLAGSTDAPLTLVFFGYTHCPDVCSAVMASLASAMTRLDDSEREQVEVVFVTTDPNRDDPPTLRAYLDRFDPEFEGVTGPLADIKTAAAALGVAVEKGEKLPSGGYDVAHGTQVVAIDPHDRSPIVWTEGTSSAQFAADLARLLDDPLETT